MNYSWPYKYVLFVECGAWFFSPLNFFFPILKYKKFGIFFSKIREKLVKFKLEIQISQNFPIKKILSKICVGSHKLGQEFAILN
jgi:hypothetical protein